MKTLRPLKKVDALPEDQRLQVAHWLKTETLQKTIELTAANFNVDIDQTTLNRFRWRCHATDYLDDSPEAKEAAIQVIHAAATARPQFTPATLNVLEQTAFKLSFTCAQAKEDMQTLTQIGTMLCRFYRNFVRRGEEELLDYFCHNQIRVITPVALVPPEYFGWEGGEPSLRNSYADELTDRGIPWLLRHPETNEWFPDLLTKQSQISP